MKKRILAFLLALALLVPMIPAAQAKTDPGEKIVYGYSGAGRELVAWRYGHGPNVMVLGFCIHGWEDNWSRDGEALVYTADKLRASLEASNLAAERGWSVYVLPCMNPDGLKDGWTCDGPGRCTTTYLDSNGNLSSSKGIDMNRCFPTNFVAEYGSRNYTSGSPLACKEAKALASFIQSVKGSKTNILMDVHGWYQQTIVYTGQSGLLYSTISKYFPQNRYTAAGRASGYLISYAHALGYDACLLELPRGIYSMTAYKNSGYATDFVNCINALLKTKPQACYEGHEYVETRVEPTCGKSGTSTKVCSVCGDTQVTVLPATGNHQYSNAHVDPTCTTDGFDAYTCTVCDYSYTDVLKAPGHSPDPETVVVLEPNTATRDGLMQANCEVCGEEGYTAPIPRVFLDTKESYYSDAVDEFYEKGYVNGISATKFAPNLALNRAMLVTILYRSVGEPEVDTESQSFADVPLDTWYTNAVAWANENGIVNGIGNDSFAPTALATREQTATILCRYAAFMGMDMSELGDGESYSDWEKVSSYAQDAMRWCLAHGIMNGTGNNMLSPKATATRAQSVTLIYRLLHYMEENPPVIDPDDPDEPDPTEPDPTEPEPTEPEPTEPEPTEPEPTEPEPTEPTPTEEP